MLNWANLCQNRNIERKINESNFEQFKKIITIFLAQVKSKTLIKLFTHTP